MSEENIIRVIRFGEQWQAMKRNWLGRYVQIATHADNRQLEAIVTAKHPEATFVYAVRSERQPSYRGEN